MFLKKIKAEIKSMHDKLFSLKESFIHKHNKLDLDFRGVAEQISFLSDKIEIQNHQIKHLSNQVEYFKFQIDYPAQYNRGDIVKVNNSEFKSFDIEKHKPKILNCKVVQRYPVKTVGNEFKWEYIVKHPNSEETTTID